VSQHSTWREARGLGSFCGWVPPYKYSRGWNTSLLWTYLGQVPPIPPKGTPWCWKYPRGCAVPLPAGLGPLLLLLLLLLLCTGGTEGRLHDHWGCRLPG
jgi:hypothetical protein